MGPSRIGYAHESLPPMLPNLRSDAVDGGGAGSDARTLALLILGGCCGAGLCSSIVSDTLSNRWPTARSSQRAVAWYRWLVRRQAPPRPQIDVRESVLPRVVWTRRHVDWRGGGRRGRRSARHFRRRGDAAFLMSVSTITRGFSRGVTWAAAGETRQSVRPETTRVARIMKDFLPRRANLATG